MRSVSCEVSEQISESGGDGGGEVGERREFKSRWVSMSGGRRSGLRAVSCEGK